MDLAEVKIKQEPDQGNNHFARISQDILLLILSKVDDIKYLCRCSLVSKHFNLTIHLIKSVSLIISSTETSSILSATEMEDLFYQIPSFTIEDINKFIQSSSLKWLNFLLFLQKFRQLKSISLNYSCPANLCTSSLFEMKVKCGDSRALVERLICIVPARVYKVTEPEYLENYFGPCGRGTFCKEPVTFGCGVEWLTVLCLLLKCQPSLESVTITNPSKSTLVLSDKHLFAWRNSMIPGGIIDNILANKNWVGVMSKLLLPVSGYLMKDVSFIIGDVKLPSHSGSRVECDTCKNGRSESVCDDAMTWQFVGDKTIIDEAVHEIFDKYGLVN